MDNRANLDAVRTKSGRPGSSAACRLYRIFSDRSAISHFFSAPVPVERTDRMMSLRFAFVKVSGMRIQQYSNFHRRIFIETLLITAGGWPRLLTSLASPHF